MRNKLFAVVFFVLSAVSVMLYHPMAQTPVTFTQARQNPEATMKKYRTVWEDHTVLEKNKPIKEYKLGDQVGTITIPRLEYYEMPVYYGSNDVNNNWQITTVGYNGGWSMFGDKGSTAVGAHNYQLFTALPTMVTGDLLIVENDADTYVYEVTGSAIYNHLVDDWEETVHQGSEPYSVTLMTCYPVDAQQTEDRYLVYTKLRKGTIYPAP